ncbi:putative nuclease HARBI1 [Tanacetum coccineum]
MPSIPNHETSQSISRNLFENSQKASRSTEKIAKWETKEDIALMAAWCHVSSDSTRGNNQRKSSMWVKVCQMYEQTRAENPKDIGPRNENQMKDAAKKKGKGKASQSFSFPNNEFVEELYAMRITRESEIEVMNKRLEVDKKREEREIKQEERELKREERELKKEERKKTKKMYLSHLNEWGWMEWMNERKGSGKNGLECVEGAGLWNWGDEWLLLQKITYECLRMSGVVARKSLMSFVQGVISCFGDKYLRRPNENDLTRLLYLGEQHGFPGWAGQYARRSGKPTIIWNQMLSYDLWIWHAFFGTPGSCNDINVLHRSPIFSDVLEVRAPKVSYVVNGNKKNMPYYLTDDIYPSWAAFVKSITSPQIRKHRLFAQHQEAVRKDVERAFGVLQARFAFLRCPCLIWDYKQMGQIMIACIIMHNMIVEDERDTYRNFDPSEFFNDMHTPGNEVVEYYTERIVDLRSYMKNREQLRNREAHSSLKNDLIEHIW